MKCVKFLPTSSAVRSPLRAESGAITAEWALALPAVLLTLGVVVSTAQVVSASSVLSSEAADAQRLIGLGVDIAEAQHQIRIGYGEGATWQVSRAAEGPIVCVTLTRDHGPFVGLGPPMPISSTRCGLDGSPEH